MARKSAKQRLSELNELRDCYSKNKPAQNFHSWDIRFINAMIERLEMGSALSKNMRTKIDSNVEQGMKEIPDCKEAKELEEFAAYLYADEKRILNDFANRLRHGRTLTEKQENFKNKLVAQAKDLRDNGMWEPSPELLERMKTVLLIKNSYATTYWYTHPVGEKAMSKLSLYIQQVENGNVTNPISENIWKQAEHAVRGTLKIFDNPRFSVNDKCFVKRRRWDGTLNRWITINEYGIICSLPKVSKEGHVCYDVLHSGGLFLESNDDLYKRAK